MACSACKGRFRRALPAKAMNLNGFGWNKNDGGGVAWERVKNSDLLTPDAEVSKKLNV